MILSHKYRYIFLKTTKTAGTSIEISLSRFCGDNDIITAISPKDEKIREELGVFPQHDTRPLTLTEILQEYSFKDILRILTNRKEPRREKVFWNHIPAKSIREKVGAEIWDNYFKFCFVRNPWDRAVSRYYWNIEKTGKTEDLDESLKQNPPNSNYNIYTIDGKLAVDCVCKYENLMPELKEVCKKLNIPFDDWLPRAKGTSRKDKRHYSEILTEEQANHIREQCAEEIDWFGYEF